MTKLTKVKLIRFLGVSLVCLGILLAGSDGESLIPNYVGIFLAMIGAGIVR